MERLEKNLSHGPRAPFGARGSHEEAEDLSDDWITKVIYALSNYCPTFSNLSERTMDSIGPWRRSCLLASLVA